MKQIKVYGIKNCDTVKKAIKWLEENGFQPELHEYRTDGLDPLWLAEMAEKLGWENLVNKRSTTWRNLDSAIKETLDKTLALEVLATQPTLIKRPIIRYNEITLLGFNQAEYQANLLK